MTFLPCACSWLRRRVRAPLHGVASRTGLLTYQSAADSGSGAIAPQERVRLPARSVALRDAGLLDDGGPFGDVVLQARGHLFRRAAAHLHAERLCLVLDVRLRNDVVDRAGEGLDGLLRGRGRYRDPVPARDLVVL